MSFYLKFPNEQKTPFCPKVTYDLVAFTWRFGNGCFLQLDNNITTVLERNQNTFVGTQVIPSFCQLNKSLIKVYEQTKYICETRFVSQIFLKGTELHLWNTCFLRLDSLKGFWGEPKYIIVKHVFPLNVLSQIFLKETKLHFVKHMFPSCEN